MRTRILARLAVALATALIAVVLSPGTANAWTVTVQISGAGIIDETTPANLMNCTSPYGTLTHSCTAGTADGPYGSGWSVIYTAAARPGYTFSHWTSPAGGAVICDEAKGAWTWAGETCSFNTWQNLSVRAVFVDTSAPTQPVLTQTPETLTTSTSATFQVGATSDPTVQGYVWRLDGGSWNQTTSRTVLLSGLGNGAHTFDVYARDYAGNTSAVKSFSWTVDTVAPTAAILTPADGIATNAANVTFTGTATDNATQVFVHVFDSQVAAVPVSNGSWSHTFVDPAEGSYLFSVTARDAAGNVSAASPGRLVTVDRTSPFLGVQTPVDGSYDRDGDVALSGTAEPGANVVVRQGATEVASVVAADDGLWNATATDVAEGTHTLTVRATDRAGNLTTVERTVIVDLTAPLAAVVSPAANATKVKRGATVIAVFSEAVRTSTVTGSTVYLVRKGTTKKVPATVTYDAATRQVTLDPRDRLRGGTVYVASVSRGVKDLAGHRLISGLRWSFRTAS